MFQKEVKAVLNKLQKGMTGFLSAIPSILMKGVAVTASTVISAPASTESKWKMGWYLKQKHHPLFIPKYDELCSSTTSPSFIH